ncbi:hypothetical protein Tco_0478234 [Tanacetum coccineum]
MPMSFLLKSMHPFEVICLDIFFMSIRLNHKHPLFQNNNINYTAIEDDSQLQTTNIAILDWDDPHDDAHPEGENSAKRQKTLEYEAYVSGESSSGQVFQEEQAPSTSGNQEQDDDFDF